MILTPYEAFVKEFVVLEVSSTTLVLVEPDERKNMGARPKWSWTTDTRPFTVGRVSESKGCPPIGLHMDEDSVHVAVPGDDGLLHLIRQLWGFYRKVWAVSMVQSTIGTGPERRNSDTSQRRVLLDAGNHDPIWACNPDQVGNQQYMTKPTASPPPTSSKSGRQQDKPPCHVVDALEREKIR
jgi:hypothetical protein